jgi:hypothetical protein
MFIIAFTIILIIFILKCMLRLFLYSSTLCFVLTLLSINSRSQSCSCKENVLEIEKHLKENYAGFKDKTGKTNGKKYLNFKKAILSRSDQKDNFYCYYSANEYLNFFNDSHLRLAYSSTGFNSEVVKSFFKNEARVEVSEKQIRQYLDSNLNTTDKIEGIWADIDNFYKIGIIRDSTKANVFLGIILKGDNIYWRLGQIKFRFLKSEKGVYEILNYLNGMHLNIENSTIEVDQNIVNIRPFGMLKRVYPEISFKHTLLKPNMNLKFELLNDSVSYISIPYFGRGAKKNIDALIQTNKQKIEASKYFIIDIRDNSGGTVYAFDSLLPFLYTNRIKVYGASVVASEKYINNCEEILKDTLISDQKKNQIRADLKILNANKGAFAEIWQDSFIEFPTILEFPKRIAILINQNTASSAELFLKAALQSRKVVIFGENSAGAVDYGDINQIKIQCLGNATLYYPTSRVNHILKFSYEQVGIPPHIRIPLFESNWNEFVIRYFQNLDKK